MGRPRARFPSIGKRTQSRQPILPHGAFPISRAQIVSWGRSKLKILVAHNRYRHRGGEDAVQEAEAQLLRQAGHCVIEYFRDNEEIHSYSAYQKAALVWRAPWSRRTYRDFLDILSAESPDLVHFHNTFPLISPSAYYACRLAETPVVQTLHNYRLLCPAGNLFRDNHVCQECVSHTLLRSVVHGCYRDSRPASAVAASVLAMHRLFNAWSGQIDLFFVCSEFARAKFIEAGFDASRLRVKPNFVAAAPEPADDAGSFALYLGRLSEEKGPQLLPPAWSQLKLPVPLRIAGEGPLLFSLRDECARLALAQLDFTGWISPAAARETLRSARFLIVPSICYEGFPLVVAEAYACGIPVIAAGHGGLAEIVLDGRTGLHFAPGDALDLAAKVQWAWTHPAELAAMGAAARIEFAKKYTGAVALRLLEDGYEFVVRQSRTTCARQPNRLPLAQAISSDFSTGIHSSECSRSTLETPIHHVCSASSGKVAKSAAQYVAANSSSYSVLGVRVDALQIPGVIEHMEEWIALRRSPSYIAVADMHCLMNARHSAGFREILQSATLTVPDGFPLVWLGRRKGFVLPRRVYGPELMASFCESTSARGYRHFFYGGAPGVADDLAARFAKRYPGLQIAGTHTPPFRPLTPEEDKAEVSRINSSHADVLWVGLGAPKQERWMFEHQPKLNVPVLVGVGAAFDFHTGRVTQAPRWMREHGFEWLFRLSQEPSRLWRRYLIYGPEFVALVLLESLRLKKFI